MDNDNAIENENAVDNENAAEDKAATENQDATEKKLRILITDDSRTLRRKLRADLEALGCEVIEATNGKEAIMLDLQHEPDGVLLDIVMPEVGGVETLQIMREVSPNVPIVMLSSAGTPQKLMQTLKMGALDFIQKPYSKDQLIKVVEAIRREKLKREERDAEAKRNEEP